MTAMVSATVASAGMIRLAGGPGGEKDDQPGGR